MNITVLMSTPLIRVLRNLFLLFFLYNGPGTFPNELCLRVLCMYVVFLGKVQDFFYFIFRIIFFGITKKSFFLQPTKY